MWELPFAVFIATILGGIFVYHYSAWRTEKKIAKLISKYKLEDLINVIHELKEALT